MRAFLAAVLVILSSAAGAQECFGIAKEACQYLKRQPEHRLRIAVEECERESPGASGSGITFCAANKLGMRARRPLATLSRARRPLAAPSDNQWVQRCLAIQSIDDRISCWEALASARRAGIKDDTVKGCGRPRMKRRYEGLPMDLANMRQNGVRSLSVSCPACHRAVPFNIDAYAEDCAVVAFGPRMVCTRCGMIGADARPIGRNGRPFVGTTNIGAPIL